MSTGIVQVTFTAAEREVAERLVEDLVGAGLVACGQVSGPVRSVYRWRGAGERAGEWRAGLQNSAARAPRVGGAVRGGHPYETPEVVVTPVVGGDADYLAWVVEESGGAGD